MIGQVKGKTALSADDLFRNCENFGYGSLEAEVERPLTGDVGLQGDVVTASGEGKPVAHAASTIP